MLPRIRREVLEKVGMDKSKKVLEKEIKTTIGQQLHYQLRKYLGGQK